MRVGIIGARRAAQGIGQYVAGHLAALGVNVVAIVGTRDETVAAAAAELERQFGLDVRGYCDAEEMFRRESLDAVAICSPQQFHAQQMEAALAHKVHVLCEKPLAFTPGADNLGVARPLAEGFAAAGLVLMVNQQWPYTLGTFDRCWPGTRPPTRPLTRLEMLLAPAEDGPGMIPNAMPHVLSLLLTCAPSGGQIEALRIVRPGLGRLDVSFEYVHSAGRVAVQTWLVQSPRQPRPAGYAINDCTVRRTIRVADYAMFLETGGQGLSQIAEAGPEAAAASATAGSDNSGWPGLETSLRRGEVPVETQSVHSGPIPLEDPLRLLLADFISRSRAERSAAAVDPAVLDNVRLLDELYAAAKLTSAR